MKEQEYGKGAGRGTTLKLKAQNEKYNTGLFL